MNAKKMERFFEITSESSVTRPIIYWHKMQLKAYNGTLFYIFLLPDAGKFVFVHKFLSGKLVNR